MLRLSFWCLFAITLGATGAPRQNTPPRGTGPQPGAAAALRHQPSSGRLGFVSFVLIPLTTGTDQSSPPAKDRAPSLSDPRDGPQFDIDGDGVSERVAWPDATQVAFLAIDRNANGGIDNGRELFGAQTLSDAPWGFAALAKLEPTDGDGAITKDDAIYSRLLLWTDLNADGRSESSELVPASAMLAKVGLGYGLDPRAPANRPDTAGSRTVNRGWAVRLRDHKNRPDDPILEDLRDVSGHQA